MKRTLMQLGIGALEEMFATSKTDAKVLRQLENELQHRQVPRAVALLDQVQLAMKRLASSVLPRSQEELPLEPVTTPAPVPAAPPPERTAAPASASPPDPQVVTPPVLQPPKPPPPPPRVRVDPLPIPAMPLEDACKLLKVTPASSWQEVELSRRRLVVLSHPRHVVGMTSERQEAIRTEARRVNAAYAVLSAARTK